jgi:flavin-dependent dehydrogenase
MGESLSPSAAPLLRELGLWDVFIADGHTPCYANASAWGGATLHHYDFLRDPRGHGWHIDRPRFERRLTERAMAAGATIIGCSAHPARVELSGDCWRAAIAEHDPIEARMLLDATGRSAWLARRNGARRIATDRQVAAVAFLRARHTPIEDTRSLVESVERGWWYSAVLPDGRMAVAFMTDADLLPRRRIDRGDWAALLSEAPHTAGRVAEGSYHPEAVPRVVSASSGHLEPMAGHGWVAVGDAAMCFDPLASHGLTVALASARDVSEAVAGALHGHPGAIDRYVARLSAAFTDYQALRTVIYGAERRWADAPYWRRRHQGSASDSYRLDLNEDNS